MSARQAIWRIRKRIRMWWDRARSPWPVVGECHGHRVRANLSVEEMLRLCPQCDGKHEHRWVAWAKAPRWIAGGPGIPIRCSVCGARKCDSDDCDRRRHTHTHWQDAT